MYIFETNHCINVINLSKQQQYLVRWYCHPGITGSVGSGGSGGHRYKSYKTSYSYTFEPSVDRYSGQTIGQLIGNCARDSGDKLAVVSVQQNIRKTYGQLNADANKLGIGLKKLGCKKGDRVGIWAPNCYEWLVTQYATAKIGAIMVSVNPGYKSNELLYALNLVGCHTLITYQKFRTTNYCEILDSISSQLLLHSSSSSSGRPIECKKIPSLKNIIVINSPGNEPEIAPASVTRFDDLLADAVTIADNSSLKLDSVDDDPGAGIQFDDPINIQFTSGTTGHPKGATLTHYNILENCYFTSKRLLSGLQDINRSNLNICIPNPLYHCFGSVTGSILCAQQRASVIMPAPVVNPQKTLEAIENYKCQVVYGTPTMYIDILNSEPHKYDTSSLKIAIMSGAPCPPALVSKVMKTIPGCQILIPYGTTETSPVISHTHINDSPKHRLESVGRPIDHLEIKIIDTATGALQPIGVNGEICVRGHCTFPGYWSQPDKTAEVIDRNRWYHMGDIGYMDDKGYLFINGRIKDMIIRGGENIYPKEIEDFLMTNQSIDDAHVVGIPHERYGEDMVAYIKLKHNCSLLDSNSVKEYCKGKITHFKIPQTIEFVDDFPRTVTGKVQKFRLREMAIKKYINTK
ncbi:medium-chain acyl-CoA ligase ACSF2, mitochondrial-like [Oppia nitens]|uniref:medium-chain acyl-CoA ligase ACSF2, mitochondrial-like n=1 Tax=Oppia nitens TaxID=1686743 RepID=UPI0023DB74AB|nr:medium-chain acyl-CoA ligase ACSF2, mitochondrial-like [Oppia nitens]